MPMPMPIPIPIPIPLTHLIARNSQLTTNCRMHILDSILTCVFVAGLFTKLAAVCIIRTTSIIYATIFKLVCAASLTVCVNVAEAVLAIFVFPLLVAGACVLILMKIFAQAALTWIIILVLHALLIVRTFLSIVLMVIIFIAELLLQVTLKIDDRPEPDSPLPPISRETPRGAAENPIPQPAHTHPSDTSRRKSRQLNSRDWNTWVPAGRTSEALTSLCHRTLYAEETHVSYSRMICERRDLGSRM